MIKFKYKIIKKEKISNNTLVIYDWSALSSSSTPKVWENVELIDHDGNVVWTVSGMENYEYWKKEDDTFVGFSKISGQWRLNTFSGYAFDLDIATGRVKFNEFTK